MTLNKDFKKYLWFVLAAAFAMRVLGIWYGLPALYNSDEPFNVVNALSYGAKKSLEPTYYVYPAFYSYILLAGYGVYYVLGKFFGAFQTALDFGAAYFLNPTGLFLIGRFLSVLMAVMTIYLVFKIGQRFFSGRTGLLAAIILTLSFTHSDLSHWILVEPAVSLFTAWALFLLLQYIQAPDLKRNLLTSVVAGLAVSTKYNAGFIFLPFTVAIFWIYKKQPVKAFLHFALGVSALLFGFLLASPYWLLSFSKYWQAFSYTLSHVSTGMVGHISSLPVIWPLWELIYQDWTIGVLMVAGFIYTLFQRDKIKILLLLFVLPTLLLIGTWQRTGVHYLLPVFPALALLAAIFLKDILHHISKRSVRYALFGLLFLPPMIKIAYQDLRLTQKDTRTFAKEWIETHIQEGSVIGYENYVYGPNLFDPGRFVKNSAESAMLPLALKERLLKEKHLRISYNLINLRKDFKLKNAPKNSSAKNAYFRQLVEMRLPKLGTIKRAGITYLIASSDNYRRYFEGQPPEKGTLLWASYQNGRRFYQSMFESDEAHMLQAFRPSLWNLGPTIRIYQFKP